MDTLNIYSGFSKERKIFIRNINNIFFTQWNQSALSVSKKNVGQVHCTMRMVFRVNNCS